MIYFLLSIVFAEPLTLQNAYNGKFTINVEGAGDKAVIFVHDDGGDKRNFEGLAGQMANESLRTVTFDLIGHGERTDTVPMDPFIYLDIQTIILQLRKDGVRDVQCVGAGFGGTLCLQAITTQTPMSQVAIISPITPIRHQSVMSNIDAYPDFPLFVIAGAQDAISLPAVLRLEEKRTLLLLNPNTSKRGTIILIEYPEMEKELRMWIWKKSDKFPRSPMKIGATIEVKGEKLPY